MTPQQISEIRELIMSFSKKISELPDVGSYKDEDYIVVAHHENNTRISKKTTVQALTEYIRSGVTVDGATLYGIAQPSDTDVHLPVNNDGVWFAITEGTYTNYGGVIVEDVPKIIYYDHIEKLWTSEELWKGYEPMSASATVNSTVGTPAVEVTLEDNVLTFTFSNLKGDRGIGIKSITGQETQESSGTNTWTLTLDDNTQSVLHTKNGNGITNIINSSPSQVSGGDNVIKVSYSNGGNNTFVIKNGAQGNSGYSGAAGELEVVNNHTQGGATAALSAEEGVVLAGMITSGDKKLESEVDISFDQQEATYTSGDGVINGTTGEVVTNASYTHAIIDVSGIDAVRFLGSIYSTQPASRAGYAFYDSEDNVLLCATYIDNAPSGGTKEYRVLVPEGAATFKTSLYNSAPHVTPSNFYCYLENGKRVVDLLDDRVPKSDLISEWGDWYPASKVPNLLFTLNTTLVEPEYVKDEIDLENAITYPCALNGPDYGSVTNPSAHIRIAVRPGDYIYIKSHADTVQTGAFLSDFANSYFLAGSAYNAVSRQNMAKNTEYVIRVPDGAVCFATTAKLSSGEVRLPQAMTVFHKQTEESVDDGGYREVTSSAVVSAAKYSNANGETVSNDNSRTGMMMLIAKPSKWYQIHYTRTSAASGPFRAMVFDTLPYTGCEGISYSYDDTHDEQIYQVYGGDNGRYALFCIGQLMSDTYTVVEMDYEQNGMLISSNAELEKAKNAKYYGQSMANTYRRNLAIVSGATGFVRWGNITSYQHRVISVEEGQYIKIITGQTGSHLLWLSEKAEDVVATSYGTPPLVTGTPEFTTWEQEKTFYFKVPAGAHSLAVSCGQKNVNASMPSFLGVADAAEADTTGASDADMNTLNIKDQILQAKTAIELTPLVHEQDSDGWEVPTTVQHLNTLKRALQMCNIKWTPKGPIPKAHANQGRGNYTPGVEVTGIPYSGPWHITRYVGIDVSLHTFMTAVNNPYSLLYTENIFESTSKSAWGRVYTETNGWAYYGTVCCGFTSASVGQPTKYGNIFIKDDAKFYGNHIIIEPEEVELLRLGDILDNDSHSVLVYGLHRTNGKIDRVKLAEASSAVGVEGCHFRTNVDTVAQLKNYIKDYSMHIYRAQDLYKNIYYEQSPFVTLTEFSETPLPFTYNNDICCFAGDRATFVEGERVVVNYNLDGTPLFAWVAMEIYKDNELLDTRILAEEDESQFDESQIGHAIDFGETLLHGKYKARLIDGNGHASNFTEWEILDTNIDVQGGSEKGVFVITNNTEHKMMYVYIGKKIDHYTMNPLAGRCLTWAEEFDQKMTLAVDQMLHARHFTTPDKQHIRITLKGDYGMASTLPIHLPGKGEEEEGDDE